MIDPIGTLLISGRGLKKVYKSEGQENLGVEVLKGLDIDIYSGEAICIMGSSGAGKSTLLHLLGALDRPSLGTVRFKDKDLTKLSDDELSRFRNKSMGFVFQFHHLLAEFSALENVMMPLLIGGESFSSSRKAAEDLLKELGLGHRLDHRPSAMSGGESQRVAIARALIRNPSIIFADEPTGNLDQKNGQAVQKLLFDLQMKRRLTLVAVTHDAEFARRFPKIRTLRDGLWQP
jgi:lipoprotein-releasing system ATP-binding protein